MAVHADIVDIETDDRRLQDEKIQDSALYHQGVNASEPIEQIENILNQPEEKILRLEEAELLQQPQLLANALFSAILYNNVSDVQYLLALYKKLDPSITDTDLLMWSQAIVSQFEKDYLTATSLYQQLVNRYPENQILRLRLAIVMFHNRDFKGAKTQFIKVRNNITDTNHVVQDSINQYLRHIDELERWHFQGGLSYLSDKNINNSPRNPNISAHFTAQKSEAAHGVYANVSAVNKTFFNHGFFTEIMLNTNGKYYWDNKKYNEFNYRMSLGTGWQNSQHTLTVSPFWERTLYAGAKAGDEALSPFSSTPGVAIEWQNRLVPDWQLILSGEYALPRYETRTHLNGKTYSASASGLYFFSPNQYLLTGFDYHRTITKDDDDSYNRKGIRLTWGKEWENGLSSRFSVNYAKRQYDGAMPIFNQIQDNTEYGLQTSLGHKKLLLFGVQPRLTWQYNRVDSNIQLYDYDKNRIFIELNKFF